MNVRWTLVVAGVLALTGTECTSISTRCENFCANLQACGMIPGPLGRNQPSRSELTDCESRCEISSNYSDLRECFDGMQLVSEDNPRKWTSGGRCAQAATCIRTIFDDDDVLGAGSASVCRESEQNMGGTVTPCLISEGESTGSESTGDESSGEAEDEPERDVACDRVLFRTVEGDETAAAGDAIIELVSDDLPTITVAEGRCDKLLKRPVHASNVPVGMYSARLKLYAKNSNHCSLYEGGEVEVLAGLLSDLNYPSNFLTSPTPCPEAEPYRCQDGIDNDGDSLVDCDDSDCEGSGVCNDTTEEGSTG